MVSYEDITIEIGFWSGDKTRRVEQVNFRGRLLASTKCLGEENEYDDWGIKWAIYQTEEGTYIVYWFEWYACYGNKVMADYAILDTLDAQARVYGLERQPGETNESMKHRIAFMRQQQRKDEYK